MKKKEKISDLLREQETLYNIGGFIIKTGISKNRLWIENPIGEGADFPIKDILELLILEPLSETVEEKISEYFNENF